MKSVKFSVVVGLVLVCCTGCVSLSTTPSIYNGRQGSSLTFPPSDSNNLLSCLQESKDLSRSEFASYYKQVASKVKRGGDADSLRFVCLSLHSYASYEQFQDGLAQFEKYIESHPDERTSLQGLYLLMKRVEREKVNRWTLRNRLMDEQEALAEENRELREKVAELQKQIEQLKNIENIIKNREL